MATSVVPDLIDALVAQATTALPDVKVYDGVGVSFDPGDYLMIGVEDPDSESFAFAADTQQEWAYANTTTRTETGDIVCAAMSWNGDGDQKAARDAVYAIAAALENLLRTNYSLGVPEVLWTGFGRSSQLSQNQDDRGSIALLTFRINFRAQI